MILAGNLNSVYSIDLSANISPSKEPKSVSILKKDLVYSIAKDRKEDYVWIGAKSGLHLIDNQSKTDPYIKTIKHFSGKKISNIFPDSLGNLWLSMPNGLGKYPRKYN